MLYLISEKRNNLSKKIYIEKEVGNFFLYLKKNFYHFLKDNKNKYYIFGSIDGVYNKEKNLKKIDLSQIPKYLRQNNENLLSGVFTIIKISFNNNIEVLSDYYRRSEVFYSLHNLKQISSSLEIFLKKKNKFDQIPIAHSLSIYGNRPFKSDTILKNVSRIMPNQFIKIIKNDIFVTENKFKPLEIKDYDNSILNNYCDAFLKNLRVKSSQRMNIIYLSSGWDSTSILAGLVKVVNKNKIRCVIGRMIYSRGKCANLFEISRAKKICKFFGVKLLIIDFDYYKPNKFLERNLFKFLSINQLANITSINHYYLAKFVSKKFGKECSIYCGEISDGAHNLGFSQYVSIFHPSSFIFREYSDKMNSYLFGPTFLNYVYSKKNLRLDPVFSIFYKNLKEFDLKNIKGNKYQIHTEFLSSFFLRSSRLPFISIKSLKLLNFKGQKEYENLMKKKSIEKYSKILNLKNIYSIYLYLYNFFHWQGSTVISFEKTCEYFGLKGHLPFLDRKIQKILSQLPENCGRGLDFNNTKFLLKEMLKKKIKYPINLQSGPHSYLYDVDVNFNHSHELLYKSSLRKLFVTKLRKKKFLSNLDKSKFNINYINKLIIDYIHNKKVSGQDLSNLLSIAMHELVYSEFFE